MKRQILLSITLILSTVPNFAQTTPPAAPVAVSPPNSPAGAVSGFAPNAVSGFTPGAISGFNPKPISGFTPTPSSTFQPGNLTPLSTSIGGVRTNSINIGPNPNIIVIPPNSQQPVGIAPANVTNPVVPNPLF